MCLNLKRSYTFAHAYLFLTSLTSLCAFIDYMYMIYGINKVIVSETCFISGQDMYVIDNHLWDKDDIIAH